MTYDEYEDEIYREELLRERSEYEEEQADVDYFETRYDSDDYY